MYAFKLHYTQSTVNNFPRHVSCCTVGQVLMVRRECLRADGTVAIAHGGVEVGQGSNTRVSNIQDCVWGKSPDLITHFTLAAYKAVTNKYQPQ